MTAQFAAIDVGTNSVNLLITDAEGNEILREVNVERLGEGLQAPRSALLASGYNSWA
jgi:exopolyphosphatase/pppGpp-phosphohydrolase